MTDARWTLIDAPLAGEQSWQASFGDLHSSLQGMQADWRVLTAGKSAGVGLLTISTGVAEYKICPTRGMGLWKARAGELPLGWNSPVRGPVHPAFVPVYDPSGLGWLEGFDELLCRCGLGSNGAPVHDEISGRLQYPVHGRIANLPAHKLTVSADHTRGMIEVQGEVDETRFHFQKLRLTTTYRFYAGRSDLEIVDQVTNLSASPAELQMLYHFNFGQPLMEAGSRVVAPVRQLVPKSDADGAVVDHWDSYLAPTPGCPEQVYLAKLFGDEQANTQVLLKNAHGTQGVCITFNLKQLPCFTLWKNPIAEPDGYATGLEPGTNFPNPRPYEAAQRRVVLLPPGGEQRFDLRLEPLTTPAQVSLREGEIAKLQTSEPNVSNKPLAGWSALAL